MKIHCFICGKVVSTDIPEVTVFRAIATCPECVEKEPDNRALELENITMYAAILEAANSSGETAKLRCKVELERIAKKDAAA